MIHGKAVKTRLKRRIKGEGVDIRIRVEAASEWNLDFIAGSKLFIHADSEHTHGTGLRVPIASEGHLVHRLGETNPSFVQWGNQSVFYR